MQEKIKSNIYLYSLLGFIFILLVSRFVNTFISFQFQEFSISIPSLLYLMFILNVYILNKCESTKLNFRIYIRRFLPYYLISLIPLMLVNKLSYSLVINILIKFVIEIIYPSILEEFYYRKVMIRFLMKYIDKFYIINILQSVFFVIIHILFNSSYLNPYSIISLLILSVISGRCFYHSGNIASSVFIHALYNNFVKTILLVL